jgi:outer membrane protein assembly factor BamA
MRIILPLTPIVSVSTIIFTLATAQGESAVPREAQQERGISLSAFPIIMYDSDVGFGFGGKGIIKNLLKKNESFDLILFGSTKGERWGVFTFAIPDFEIRQGTVYALACDVEFEYDRILKSNFFGFGNDTQDNDWQFPKRFVEAGITLSRGWTTTLITEAGFVYNNTNVYDYDSSQVFTSDIPGADEHTIPHLSLKIRWDTRDSQNHPHHGWNVCASADIFSESFFSDYSFRRYRLRINEYQQLFSPAHILASRLWLEQIQGTAPYYERSIIGGGSTARGFKADRFMDQTSMLSSIEYRLTVIYGIGAVLFTDAGRVFPKLKDVSFDRWHISYGGGLRYYLSNFVVRFDMGFSNEGMRIFFNFGHVF